MIPVQSPFRILVVDDNPAIHEDFGKIFAPKEQIVQDLDETEAALFGEPMGSPMGAHVTSLQPPSEPSLLPKMSFEIQSAYQGKDAAAMVAKAMAEGRPYSIAFVDMRMPPGWDGVQTLQALWAIDPHLQCIICTAYSDYSWDQITQQLGLKDNLLILKKPFDVAEVQQMACAMGRKWQLTKESLQRLQELERWAADRNDALKQSHEQFAVTFHAAPMPQALFRFSDGACLDANSAFCELTRTTITEWKTQSVDRIRAKGLMAAVQGPHPLKGKEMELAGDGKIQRPISAFTQVVYFGSEPCLQLMIQDISERHQIEEQMRHSEKMEAVGQLAAGIAHDFNNLLTVIQGNLSLLHQAAGQDAIAQTLNGIGALSDLASTAPPGSPGSPPRPTGLDTTAIEETIDAAKRAASLTKQLLTFSKKQAFKPLALDLNDLLQRQARLLHRVLGQNVEIRLDCKPGIPFGYGDAASLEQVVTSLAINARDAMPEGGVLKLSSAAFKVDASQIPAHADAQPGPYVRITVTDSGCGMDEATIQRVFEPFFTTKGIGEGTGMGLAMVYATLRQHQGWITVRSSVGKGTSFSLFIPVSSVTEINAKAEDDWTPRVTFPAPPKSLSLLDTQPTNLRVLLVEDEPAVRRVMNQMLVRHGCTVIEGENALQGFDLWDKNRDEIDLIITDMVMPGGQTGEDLAKRVLGQKPDLSIIYCSGYSPGHFEGHDSLVTSDNFLPKPYDADNVRRILRSVWQKTRLSQQPVLSP